MTLSKKFITKLENKMKIPLNNLIVKAIVLMIGTKIVAIFNEKENQYFHTKEHDLTKQEIAIHQNEVVARYKYNSKKFDENSLKRADIYYYFKTTKRGRVYKPTPKLIGNITSTIY